MLLSLAASHVPLNDKHYRGLALSLVLGSIHLY
jgi:hypothetical protein